jgi:hypothetical protein
VISRHSGSFPTMPSMAISGLPPLWPVAHSIHSNQRWRTPYSFRDTLNFGCVFFIMLWPGPALQGPSLGQTRPAHFPRQNSCKRAKSTQPQDNTRPRQAILVCVRSINYRPHRQGPLAVAPPHLGRFPPCFLFCSAGSGTFPSACL